MKYEDLSKEEKKLYGDMMHIITINSNGLDSKRKAILVVLKALTKMSHQSGDKT